MHYSVAACRLWYTRAGESRKYAPAYGAMNPLLQCSRGAATRKPEIESLRDVTGAGSSFAYIYVDFFAPVLVCLSVIHYI